MHHVIIGNGVAGITAAEAIRKADRQAAVTVLAAEPYPYYSRIRLIDFLAGTVQEEGLLLKKAEWYAEQGIEVRLGCPAQRLDTAAKQVCCADGTLIPYGKLLIAAGATSFVPPVPGIDQAGIFTLRTLDDAKAIRQAAAGGKQVVLLGGGILSLEAASALAKTGCQITVIEFFHWLLPRQMDSQGSTILKGMFERRGMRFFLGAATREFTGGKRVERVMLTDGTAIPCEMVLVGAGVRSDLRLAQAAGLSVDKGITVNDRMETSVPDVYAAGDVASHRGMTYGIWPAAMKQGQVAGENMAGGEADFPGMVMTNTLKVAGIDLFSLGDIDNEGVREAVTFSNPEQGIYKKLVLHEGRAAGAILLGDLAGRHLVQKAVQEGRSISGQERQAFAEGRLSSWQA